MDRIKSFKLWEMGKWRGSARGFFTKEQTLLISNLLIDTYKYLETTDDFKKGNIKWNIITINIGETIINLLIQEVKDADATYILSDKNPTESFILVGITTFKDVKRIDSYTNLDNNQSNLLDTIEHELLHAFEDYRKRNKAPIDNNKSEEKREKEMMKTFGEAYHKLKKGNKNTISYHLKRTEISSYTQTLYRFYERWLDTGNNRDLAIDILQKGDIDKIFNSSDASMGIRLLYSIYIANNNEYPKEWLEQNAHKVNKEVIEQRKAYSPLFGAYHRARPQEHAKFYRGFMNTLYNITKGIEDENIINPVIEVGPYAFIDYLKSENRLSVYKNSKLWDFVTD